MTASNKRSLIAMFGGSFDPVHYGHLRSIELLQEELNFARVHWVVSARPPHKERQMLAFNHRFAMLQLAIKGCRCYVADARENERENKSYTIDTVHSLHQDYPGVRLCLIIGGDSLNQFHRWHRAEELAELVDIIALARPGYDFQVPDFLRSRLIERVEQLSSLDRSGLCLFTDSAFKVSSTEIRSQLSRHGSTWLQSDEAENVLPRAVRDYIKVHKLYPREEMKPLDIKDAVLEVLESVKGQDIVALDISEISNFADHMIIASGTSDTHVKALARNSISHLRDLGVKPINEDGADLGEWILVDFGDVVLHVMRPEVRSYYQLEKFWDVEARKLFEQHRSSETN